LSFLISLTHMVAPSSPLHPILSSAASQILAG
jgi:hypothetical protein